MSAKLKPEVLELSHVLSKGITIDHKSGVGAETGHLYNDNLPEGITTEVVKAISDYNSAFVAAGTHAFGELSVKAMTGNKAIERTSLELQVGSNDQVSFTMDRHREYPNHLSGGEAVHKYGVINSNLEIKAGKNGGQLKQARLLIQELALTKLK